MSNDLISRQEVLNFIQGIKDKIIENQCFGDNTRKINMGDLNDILIFIRYTQTAYDIDKVMEELTDLRDDLLTDRRCLSAHQIGKAIKIVKAGVKNDEL